MTKAMRTTSFFATALSLLLLACGSASGGHGSESGGEVSLTVTGSDGVGSEESTQLGTGWGSHGTSDKVDVACSRSPGAAGKSVLHVAASMPVSGHTSYDQGLDLQIRDFTGAGTYRAMGRDGSTVRATVAARLKAVSLTSAVPSELIELSMVSPSACTFVATSELEGTVECTGLAETSTDLDSGESRSLPSAITVKGKWSCDKLIDE